MKVTVKLKTLVGQKQTPLGPVDVAHDVYVVMVSTEHMRATEGTPDFVQVGLVGKEEGQAITFTQVGNQLPDNLKEAVIKAVSDKLGGMRRATFPKPLPPDQDDNATIEFVAPDETEDDPEDAVVEAPEAAAAAVDA